MYSPRALLLKATLVLAIVYIILDLDSLGLPVKLQRRLVITVRNSNSNSNSNSNPNSNSNSQSKSSNDALIVAQLDTPSLTSSLLAVVENHIEDPVQAKDLSERHEVEYFDEHNITGYDAHQSFFVYSPSGGLNNQRMEIEYALHICKLLNRTLLVPMLGPHTSLWYNYRKVARVNLCPADFIFEIPNMETYGPKVMPLNCTIDVLEQKLLELPQGVATVVYHRERRRDWHADQVRSELRPIRSKVIYLKGPTMFHNWFPPYIVTAVRSKSRYTTRVRRLALELVDASLPRVFNALHVRLGDRGDRGITAKGLTEIMTYRNFSVEVPVYIATEPGDIDSHPDLFLPLEAKWKVVYAKDLAPKQAMNEFRSHFTSRLRDDMFGVVEQLICTAAYKFKGSPFSRFTQFIGFMRQHKKELFPEYYERESLFQVHNLEDATAARSSVYNSKLVREQIGGL